MTARLADGYFAEVKTSAGDCRAATDAGIIRHLLLRLSPCRFRRVLGRGPS